MSQQEQKPMVCPKCGGTHMHRELQMTFKGTLIEAMEKMAKRRGESVDQLVYHLLWLEAGKIPGVRALMEQDSTDEH